MSKVQRKYLIGITTALILVGAIYWLQISAILTPQARSNYITGIEVTSSPTNDANLPMKGPPGPPTPLTLNTVDYALSVVRDKVLIPDANKLGQNYKIIGVDITVKPESATTNNGITYRNWVLNFLISDMPFINGTTSNTDLSGHLIIVSEKPSTGYYSSRDAAVDSMKPSEICHTDAKTSNTTCTSVPQSNSGQLVQIRDTYLVAQQEPASAYFTIDEVNRIVLIYGDLSYQQLFALSGSVIP